MRAAKFPLRIWLGRAAIAWFAALLVACAPVSQRPVVVADEAMQSAREAELGQLTKWSFTGRLAVSQGNDGGNARIEWQQDGADFDIRVSAPITGRSWRLRQVAGRVFLEGLASGPSEGSDAEAMLQDALGWRIPTTALAAWVRGARVPGISALSFDQYGLPATISQQGWSVEYRGWFAGSPALPEKIFVRQGEARVKLLIERWGAP